MFAQRVPITPYAQIGTWERRRVAEQLETAETKTPHTVLVPSHRMVGLGCLHDTTQLDAKKCLQP